MYNICLALIILFALSPSSFASNFNTHQFEQEIDILIDEYKIPGLALAIIDDKKIIYQNNYGVASYETNQRINSKTIWQIASISKTFLATSLGMLEDKGKFSWNSKIYNEIKEFSLKDPASTNKITFHDLASMQTGLPIAAGKEYIANTQNRKEIINIFRSIKPIYPIGEGYFTYQYGLISLVEQLIENKTKKSWGDFLKELIFIPLKLNSTGVDIYNLNNNPNIAMPHDEYNNEIKWEKFKVNSAAGLYSNLDDMVKWLQFNMKKGRVGKKQLISIAQMEKIHKKYTPIKNFETMLFKDQNISSIYYGYFWKTVTYNLHNKNIIVYEHNGNCDGISAIIAYMPNKNLGIVVLSNKSTPVPEIIRSKFVKYLN